MRNANLDIGNSLLDIGHSVHVIVHPQPPLPPLLRVVKQVVRCSGGINASVMAIKSVDKLEIDQKVIAQIEPRHKIPGRKFLQPSAFGQLVLVLKNDGFSQR